MKENFQSRFVFDIPLFAGLFFLFVLFYGIESFTHECGHYIAARVVGHRQPVIHYKSTDTGRNALQEEFRWFGKTYKDKIARRERLPNHERYAEVCTQLEDAWEQMKAQKFTREHAIIAMAGPLETVLTGMVGLLIMLYKRKKFEQAERLKVWQWIVVFAALFWLVPAVGLFAGIAFMVVPGLSDTSSDIYRMCLHFGINNSVVYLAMGALGVMAVVATFKLVPRKQRLTLGMALIVGGTTGYFLWNIVGPVVLP